MLDLSLMLVFGLVSSLHCVTMCGPLIAIASAPLHAGSEQGHDGPRTLMLWQVNYQLGRGITYVTIGVVLGFAGKMLSALFPARLFGGFIQIAVAALFIGLALFAILRGRTVTAPSGGSGFGRLIRRFVTSGRASGMFVLGLLTGFLPCGVLYAAFARSLAADSPTQGGLLMLAFWLGSAPLLIVVGLASGSLLRTFGRYANVLVAIAMLVTGAWIGFKGVKNLTTDAPMPQHGHAVHETR
jgi:sulfite exporter TauE/SafE